MVYKIPAEWMTTDAKSSQNKSLINNNANNSIKNRIVPKR